MASQETVFEQLMAHQRDHYHAELASRLCLSGPHKDDIEVSIGGAAARAFSSQGQTRTAALSLKLAERDIFRELTGFFARPPARRCALRAGPRRQEFVLNRISGGQVFITCCEEDRLETLLGGKVLHVENGKVV